MFRLWDSPVKLISCIKVGAMPTDFSPALKLVCGLVMFEESTLEVGPMPIDFSPALKLVDGLVKFEESSLGVGAMATGSPNTDGSAIRAMAAIIMLQKLTYTRS